MSSGLFLAPATRRNDARSHFQLSMVEGVSAEFYDDYTDSDWGGTAPIWGLTTNTRPTWETVNEGDWVLFYTESNAYQYAARVAEKEHNPELGDAIRSELLDADDEDERDWDFLLFFEEPVSVSATGEEVAELLDYGNIYPVRFIRVTDERLEALEGEYGDVESFIEKIREE